MFFIDPISHAHWLLMSFSNPNFLRLTHTKKPFHYFNIQSITGSKNQTGWPPICPSVIFLPHVHFKLLGAALAVVTRGRCWTWSEVRHVFSLLLQLSCRGEERLREPAGINSYCSLWRLVETTLSVGQIFPHFHVVSAEGPPRLKWEAGKGSSKCPAAFSACKWRRAHSHSPRSLT